MAVIDLRSVTLWITDGSSPITGATTGINTSAMPAVLPFTTPATTTLACTGFTTEVVPGQYIQFASHMQFYEVLSVVNTVAATTSLTIYPALLMPITATEAIHVVGNGIYAKLGEGNLTYSEKRNLIYVRDRGFIDTMKIGDDEPVDVSLDFTWEFLRSAGGGAPPTFEEAIKQVGGASNWVSTAADPCEPYSVNVWVLDIPPCGTDAESIQLPEFRWTGFDHDLKGGKVSVKASCNVLQASVVHSTSP